MAVIRQRKDKDGKEQELQWQAIVRMKNRATGLVHQETETFESKRQADEWAGVLLSLWLVTGSL